MTEIVEGLRSLAVLVDDLHPDPRNPRRGDVEAIARSLEMFGQRKPVVAKRDGTVIAGNHLLAAARSLGWEQVAAVFVDDNDTQATAYGLADNRTADLGTYDNELLAELIEELAQQDDEDLFAATGYTDKDLDALLTQAQPPAPAPTYDPDAIPAAAPKLTQPGDLWLLGPHRLMCGDARSPADFGQLLEGALVNLAVTSPPYASQRVYDQGSGFTPIHPDEYVDWFAAVAAHVAASLAKDGSWMVNIKANSLKLDTPLYVHDLVCAHVRQWGWHYATEYCWERMGFPGEPRGRLKNQFEPVYQFTRGPWKFRPEQVRHASDSSFAYNPSASLRLTVEGTDEKPGREFKEGWAYPGNRLPPFTGTHEALGHSAAFPVGLPQFFIKLLTDPADKVLDPFAGSGSTMMAAHGEGRMSYGMELSPGYVDIACLRFEQATGITPMRASTGESVTFLDKQVSTDS